MFDYLEENEANEIANLLQTCQDNPEIKIATELLAGLHVPATSLLAIIYYQKQLPPTAELESIITRLKVLELSEEFATNPENEKKIYRELFITLGSSIDVLIIKLAMELAYLRYNKGEDNDKIRAVAKLSQDIYAPLCHRLGLGEMKIEFEDLSLYVLDPDNFFEIVRKLQLKKNEREQIVTDMIEIIEKDINEVIPHYRIFGRSKHIYSIYNKMKKSQKQYEELLDLLAIRIVCQTEVECYTILGMIHQLFPPLDNRFKDYISRPKPNMYQSLHTTVKGINETVFEIQIRTEEMDKIAELGVAAHFAYKEGSSAKNDVAKKLTNLKDFIASGDFEAEDYQNILRQDILDDQIYVLTPARKIMALPKGATVVDFAFKIHTNVGEKMVGAKINDKIANYGQELKTNDVIEILTKSNAPGPNETWLDYCVSTHARNKVRSYLKKKADSNNETKIERGKELFYKEAEKRKVERRILDDQKRKNEIFKQFKVSSIYELFANIADHKTSASDVINFLNRERENDNQPKQIRFVTDLKTSSSVIIPGAEEIKYELAKCCMPVYGDDIVARAKTGVAFKVHRQGCKEATDRCIDAHWNRNSLNKNTYGTNLKVVAINHERILNDIINMLSTSNVGVIDFKKSVSSDLITMVITVSVYDVAHIDVAIANIKKNSLVKTIVRV